MRFSDALTIIALAALPFTASPIGAQSPTGAEAPSDAELPESGPTRAEQEAMAEIFALQRRIETLLDGLSPEARASMRRHLEALAVTTDGPAIVGAEASEAAAAAAGADGLESAGLRPDQSAPAPADSAAVAEPSSAPADAMAGVDFSFLPPPRARLAAPSADCNTLALFDSDGDGMLTARDRYWRHFYLWSDGDGDGEIAETEVLSAYERGVRAIPTGLDHLVHADDTAGTRREIELDRYIVLDLFGNGFDSSPRMGDDGILVVDASRLSRGNGPQLRDETGLPLAGLQAFRSGLRLALATGEVIVLGCP